MTEGNFVKQGDFSIEIGDIFTSKTQRLGKKDVTRICGAQDNLLLFEVKLYTFQTVPMIVRDRTM